MDIVNPQRCFSAGGNQKSVCADEDDLQPTVETTAAGYLDD